MSIISSFFQKGAEPPAAQEPEELVIRQPVGGSRGELMDGMRIDVMTGEREFLLSGRILEFTEDGLTLGRLPGEFSFKISPLNATVTLSGFDKRLIPVCMSAVVQESTRTVFKVKDMKAESHAEGRENFRLPLSAPVSLYRKEDEHYRHPEDCQLVNVSTGGCCIESDYVHVEDEVLRIRIKLEEYSPLNFMGQIIRCTEHAPGKFWYGILFAQLTEQETTSLNRTLFNLQMGIRNTHMRTEDGYWSTSSKEKRGDRR